MNASDFIGRLESRQISPRKSGTGEAPRPAHSDSNASLSIPEAILRSYVQHEARLESQGWRPYHEVLREVMIGIAADFGVPLSDSESNTLVDSLPVWPPVPDTVAALPKLASRFRLMIPSNTDDALFAETRKRLHLHFGDVSRRSRFEATSPDAAPFCFRTAFSFGRRKPTCGASS